MTPLSPLQKLLASLIFLAIIGFSLFRLTESPPFNFDEGWVTQVATNIAQHGIDGLQFAPGHIQHVSILTSVGYTLIYALAFWFKLFGAGVLQARLMMLVYMLAFAAVAFIFLRRLYGSIFALSALAIIAAFPPFYTFGKEVVGEVPVLFYLASFLLFLHLAMSDPRRKPFWLILAGLAAGLCIVTKTMCIVFAPVLCVVALMAWRRKLVSWREISMVVLAALVPIVVWILVNFQKGDTLSAVLDYYSNPAALTDKTATFHTNLRLIFTTLGSLSMLLFTGIWAAGIGVRLKGKTQIPLGEWVAFMFSAILLISLPFRYFDARYLFPMQVLAIMFIPYSAHVILGAIPKISPLWKARVWQGLVLIICILGFYQLMFASYLARTYTSTRTADLTRYFGSIATSTSIFFYDSTHVIPFFHGTNYYQRIVIFEKWVLGSDFAPVAAKGSVDMLVLNPEMSKADQKVSLNKYARVAQFGETEIYRRKQ